MYVDEKALPEVPVKQLEPWQEYCLKAADYIDEHGWCQQHRKSGDKVCLMGALLMAAGEPLWGDFNPSSKAWRAWGPLTRAAGGCPVHFNDSPRTTKEQVTALLRSVAK